MECAATVERRTPTRLAISLPTRVRAIHGLDRVDCRTVDLSERGIGLASPVEMVVGSKVEVSFPINCERLDLSARVVGCSRRASGTGFRVALTLPYPEIKFRMKFLDMASRVHELRRRLSRATEEPISAEEAARRWVDRYARVHPELYRSRGPSQRRSVVRESSSSKTIAGTPS